MVQQIESPLGHFYKHEDSMPVPSVTNILDYGQMDFLVPWGIKLAVEEVHSQLKADPRLNMQQSVQIGKDEHERVKNWHRDLGTFAHANIEENTPPPIDHPEFGKNAYNIFQSWRDFLNESNYAYADMEFEKAFVGKGEHAAYGGKLDIILKNRDGTHTILELKSSRTLIPKHAMQAAAYARLAAQHGYLPTRILVLRLGKYKIEWECRTVKYEPALAAFDAVHHAYLMSQDAVVFE